MSNKIISLIFIAVILLLSENSQALTYEYVYTGSVLYPDQDISGTGLPEFIRGPSGVIVIHENALPGGTLVNADVSFLYVPSLGPDSPFNIDTPLGVVDDESQVDGFLEFTLHFLPASVRTNFDFTTDENRNIISWSSLSLQGPPDEGTSSLVGDFIEFGFVGSDRVVYSGDPGSWSPPRVIPLPGTAILFSSGLFGLFVTFRRRIAGKKCLQRCLPA